MKAAIEAAHSLGRPVAVHAISTEGMRRAILTGVDTIEHGYRGTAELFRKMAARGTTYMPTLTAVRGHQRVFPALCPGSLAAH
jgi:imidazolonepropionase-like amidohydrolase